MKMLKIAWVEDKLAISTSEFASHGRQTSLELGGFQMRRFIVLGALEVSVY